MPTDNAKPIRVMHLVYPEITLLDLAGPRQVFREVSQISQQPGYRQTPVSLAGGLVATDDDVVIQTRRFNPRQFDIGTLLVVPGGLGVFDARRDPQLIKAIAAAHRRGATVMSTCTGAFLLAQAGLLDGLTATTHWQRCQQLQREYPTIQVVDDTLFVANPAARVWTSAGVTAGIDLALALVESDWGRRVALDVARTLVVYGKRAGGQTQFSAHLRDQFADAGGEFDTLHAWVRQHLDAPITIEQLAEQQGMTLRSFHRRYRAVTGVTPGQMLLRLRVDHARAMLTDSSENLGTIADRCGLGSEESLRRAFRKLLGVAPGTYRTNWQAAQHPAHTEATHR